MWLINPSIIPFNLQEMHLERLSKKVKFALIDRRNATREQVPIGHFTMFKGPTLYLIFPVIVIVILALFTF